MCCAGTGRRWKGAETSPPTRQPARRCLQRRHGGQVRRSQRDRRVGTNPIAVSPFLSQSPSHGHGGAIIEDVYLADAAGVRQQRIEGGETVALHIRGRALQPIARPVVGFIFRDALGQNLFGDNTYLTYSDHPRAMAAGDPFHAVLEFRLPFLPLGTYTIAPSIIDGTQQSHVQLFWIEEALMLTVDELPIRIGKIGVPMRICGLVQAQ